MDSFVQVRFCGPLVPLVDGLRSELFGLGYAPVTVRVHLQLWAHVSRWLGDRALQPAELTETAISDFLVERRRTHVVLVSPGGLAPGLGWLRRTGAVPPAVSEVVAGDPVVVLQAFQGKGVSISVPSDAHGGWAVAPGQFGPSDVQPGWCGSWSAWWRRRGAGPSGLPQRLVGDRVAGDGVLQPCVEQQATTAGVPSIEPEHPLIEVGPHNGAHQPAGHRRALPQGHRLGAGRARARQPGQRRLDHGGRVHGATRSMW